MGEKETRDESCHSCFNMNEPPKKVLKEVRFGFECFFNISHNTTMTRTSVTTAACPLHKRITNDKQKLQPIDKFFTLNQMV